MVNVFGKIQSRNLLCYASISIPVTVVFMYRLKPDRKS